MNELESARANVLPVNFAGIPQELHPHRHFLLWRYDLNERGEIAKVPYGARTGQKIDPLNSSKWVYLEDAQRAYESGKWSGIGFALVSTLIAIDFDHVTDSSKMVQLPYLNFIKHLTTYFELSPSGNGVRGFLHGKSGERTRGAKNNLKVEIYDRLRYVSVTGNRLPFSPTTIDRNQAKFDTWYNYLFPPATVSPPRTEYVHDESVNAIIERASKAKNGAKFDAFMRGDWKGAGGYETKSSGDFAFAIILLFWVNGDIQKADAIFRQSGMYNLKWDRPTSGSTYGMITLQKALAFVK